VAVPRRGRRGLVKPGAEVSSGERLIRAAGSRLHSRFPTASFKMRQTSFIPASMQSPRVYPLRAQQEETDEAPRNYNRPGGPFAWRDGRGVDRYLMPL